MAGLAGQTLGRYELIEEIGRGGMATVVLAVDTRNDRKVAVKVLSPTISGDSRFIRRFRREAALLSQLRHPNIVPILTYGESRGYVYMVMPLVPGDTLQDRIDKGRVKEKKRRRWIQQIASALDFAHSKGVVHRDIKPANVMIDRNGNALLTDFGLARLVEGSNSLTGSMLLGTPAFIAPEQGRGDRVDSRSDQYSLGVILFLLETGRLPFEADSPMGTVLMHIQKPVPRPSRFNPKLPMAVERVILKSLAKDPDYRYPSVGALYQAYQAALEGASAADLDFPTASVSRDGQLHEESEVYQSPKPKGFLQKPPRREWLWALGVLAAAVAAFLGGSHLIDRLGGSLPWQLRQVEQVPTQISLPPSTEPSPTVVKTPSPIPPLTSANCPGVSIFAPVASGNDVSWTIVNEEPTAIELVELSTIEFPEANEKLVQVRLGSEVLWEGEAWKGQEKFIRDSDRSIAPGMTRRLTLRFYYAAVPHGYRLEANFGQDCVLMGSW